MIFKAIYHANTLPQRLLAYLAEWPGKPVPPIYARHALLRRAEVEALAKLSTLNPHLNAKSHVLMHSCRGLAPIA